MDLYFRVPSVLELLAHQVAEMAGLYREAGVEVILKDGSGAKWAEVEQIAPLSIGLGGMTLDRLRGHTNWCVVCVNTQHPLFWLITQPSVQRVADLKGARIAGLAPPTAPTTFLRILFRRHGLDLLNDCSYDSPLDEQRLEQFRSGELGAIYTSVGQAGTPFTLERSGFRLLAFIGAEVPASAPGIAVNQDLVAADDPEVLRVVRATRSALERVHADRELAVRATQEIERGISQEDAGLLYDRYVKPYWTRDGRPDRQIAESSLQAIARELEITQVPDYSELYKIP